MEKRKKRIFTEEFKAEAVNLYRQSGKTKAEIARDLGVTHTCIGQWIKQADIEKGNGPRGALTLAERDELVRARKEIRVLRMERDLLKKSVAFFARETTEFSR
jgi:transposase-like protein